MMILAPDFIDQTMFLSAVNKSRKKLGDVPVSLRLAKYHEGLSLQIMHIGGYDEEGPKLSRLHDQIMPSEGLSFAGKHHEIYLSDARKTATDKLRTILRQPIRPN